jgi:murein DD-endopeptidase MepM/ murein hydrolase activator NlpD
MKFLVAFFFLSGYFSSFGQFSPRKNYATDYFAWPVKAPVAIVANFGELRPNHFHMGLDCRTNQKENLPILAAADGYIAKVKIEPSGFGRCIYVNHPNGLTTVYAHLNDFAPGLEQYVTEQQYAMQQWNVFLDIPPGKFPVNRGDFIAYSGNTGGSQGPHLHFEIRETASDKVINPLLFEFPIPDREPPIVYRLAVYDRTKSTYEQNPRIYPVRKVNGVYTPASGRIAVNSPLVSFAITAFDRYTGSTNQNGIYETLIYDNNVAVSGFRMDYISYDETRFLNAHIDHRLKSNGGPYLQHLSRLPGYTNGIYMETPSDGVISLKENEEHSIRITVMDPQDNISTVAFSLSTTNEASNPGPYSYSGKMFHPGMVNVFDTELLNLYLPENVLYDSFYFRYSASPGAYGKLIHQVHNPSVPLHDSIPIRIKEYFDPADADKIVMKRFYGNKQEFQKANFRYGWYEAWFREFGNFQLIVDKSPPQVTPLGFRDGMNAARIRRIAFAVTDDTKRIKKFTALLDGKWLRFTNDKGRNFIYEFDQYCAPGQHELIITAEDQVGNTTTKTFRFTR